MVAVSEVFKAWQQGLANKDTSSLAELLTEDFRFVGVMSGRNNTKQEALNIVASADNSMAIDNLEVIYENEEVGVVLHSANSSSNNSKVMAVYTKKDGKFSQVTVMRAVTGGMD